METIIKMMDVILSVAAIIGGAHTMKVQRDLGEYTPPAELRYVETEAVQTENELVFGNLAIKLPGGVCAEIEEKDDADSREGQTIVLDGAEKRVGNALRSAYKTGPFPPQIHMARYVAEYECEEALFCALFELFHGGNLCVQYEDRKNNEYIFRMGSGDYGEQYYTYAIVRGGDLYLVGEYDMESGYSFSALREQGKIKWQDSGRIVERSKDISYACFMVTPEEGMSFLCNDISNDLYFYLEGYYDRCCAFFETGYISGYLHSDAFTDVNFDGCTDIYINSERILIWDVAEKKYMFVHYPKDMPHSWHWRSFPETETIWGNNYDYLGELSHNNMDYTESLWQWDGYVPVKRRECRAEVREDGVRIWAYEGTCDHILFDEIFTLEEWDDGDNENIRTLYRQFYDGLVPEDFSGSKESRDSDIQEKIPQGLLDKMADAMSDDMTGGTVFELLRSMLNLSVLTDEEDYEAARINDDIRVNVLLSCQGGGYVLVRSDVDNDGIEDILGEFYWGGSSGYTKYILFEGQADGTYHMTDAIDATVGEFSVIAYDGKNYLVCMFYDYDGEYDNCFSVMEFEEGLCVEEARLIQEADEIVAGAVPEVRQTRNYRR